MIRDVKFAEVNSTDVSAMRAEWGKPTAALRSTDGIILLPGGAACLIMPQSSNLFTHVIAWCGRRSFGAVEGKWSGPGTLAILTVGSKFETLAWHGPLWLPIVISELIHNSWKIIVANLSRNKKKYRSFTGDLRVCRKENYWMWKGSIVLLLLGRSSFLSRHNSVSPIPI